MLTRILTVALAVGTLAAGTAYAQTGSGTGSSTSGGSSTTSPSTGAGTSSGTGTGSTMGSGGSSTQQAQGAFDVTKYKTKAECLSAARSAKADTTLCAMMGTEFSQAYVKLKTNEWNAYTAHFSEWERANTLDV